MHLTLKIWRQDDCHDVGRLETYYVADVSPDMSFLEMLDVLNEKLVHADRQPIAFDHDCREGICGACSLVINGQAHGPDAGTTVCQLHMRRFHDGDTIHVEPWRANAFPVLRDLVVDRGALDRIIAAGGFISAGTGSAPEANAVLVPKNKADEAFDSATCIGCGACVAACPNSAAMLFVAAKISHLSLLPQGEPERHRRVVAMVDQMDREGFGNCTNHFECEAACPKEISVANIARMNREFLSAAFRRGAHGADSGAVH